MMMPPRNRGEVTLERDGKKYRASYEVKKGIITLSTGYRIKASQLGTLPPKTLAIRMLIEMIEAGDA